MLPPFRIRNLYPPARNPPFDGKLGAGSLDAVVMIDASDYDATLARNPEAVLRYFDEIDRETITVGTSLELAQKLDEPLPTWPGTEQTHHIFDIDNGLSPMRIWQAYLQEGKEINPNGYDNCTYTLLSPLGNVQDEKDLVDAKMASQEGQSCESTKINFSQHCQLCVQARRPPKLLNILDDHKPAQGNSKPDPQDFPHEKDSKSAVASSSCLTLEGKRQARIAGHRMRTMTGPSCCSKKAPTFLGATSPQNRWASYSRSTSPFFIEHLATPMLNFQDNGDRAGKCVSDKMRQPESAGDKLWGKTNRIRHCKSAQGLSEHSINKSHCVSPSTRRSVRSNKNDYLPDKSMPLSLGATLESQPLPSTRGPKSLLQIFESELAQAKSSPEEPFVEKMARPQTQGTASGPNGLSEKLWSHDAHNESVSVRTSSTDKAKQQPLIHPTLINEPNVCQSIHEAVDAIEKVMTDLHQSASSAEQDRDYQNLSQTLTLGLSTALEGFNVCIRDISETVRTTLANKGQAPGKSQQSFNVHKSSATVPRGAARIQIARSTKLRPQDELSHVSHQVESQSSGLRRTTVAPTVELSSSDRSGIVTTGNPSHAVTLPIIQTGDVAGKTKDVTRGRPPLDLPIHTSLLPRASFTALPTMRVLEPKIYMKPPTQSIRPKSAQELNTNLKFYHSAASPQPSFRSSQEPVSFVEGSTQPEESVRDARETESSGQFFNRMTGRAGNPKVAACNSNFANEHTVELQQSCSLQKGATVSEPKNGHGLSNGGSCMIGSSRPPWNLDFQQESASQIYDIEHPGTRHALQDMDREAPLDERIQWPANTDWAFEHNDPATVSRTQICVEQLESLGFGSNSEDGLGRLVVFAQAANGDLSSAIDIINEEQQAYSHRF